MKDRITTHLFVIEKTDKVFRACKLIVERNSIQKTHLHFNGT